MRDEISESQFEYFDNMDEFLDNDAFKVHDVMFTCRDLIQSLVYTSPFIYTVVKEGKAINGVNTFMITVNDVDEMILCQAGKHSKVATRLTDGYGPNSVMRHRRSGTVTFFFSRGYMLDNFDFQKPDIQNDGAFLVPESGDLLLAKKDLEFLMKAA